MNRSYYMNKSFSELVDIILDQKRYIGWLNNALETPRCKREGINGSEYMNSDGMISCFGCSAESPVAGSHEEAYQKAMQRFQEMQKPLTLEEVKQSFGCFFVQYRGSKRDEYGYIPYITWSGTVEIELFGSSRPIIKDVEEYGVTWRCWRTSPTNEERAAAKW